MSGSTKTENMNHEELNELEDFSIEELKAEINRRKEVQFEEESKRLPKKEDIYPYTEVDKLVLNDNSDSYFQIFYAHVDEGSEGIPFLIRLNHEVFDGINEENKKLEETIRHAVLTSAIEGGWDDNLFIENISIGQLGEYGINYLVIDKPKEEEED